MSHENVETVHRAVTAFNDRDVEAFTALTTPDFEWLPSMTPVEAQTFVGPDGIRKYFENLGIAWERFQILPADLRAHARGLLVLGRVEGHGRNSGARVDAALGMAFDLRGGMISRIRGYLDLTHRRGARPSPVSRTRELGPAVDLPGR